MKRATYVYSFSTIYCVRIVVHTAFDMASRTHKERESFESALVFAPQKRVQNDVEMFLTRRLGYTDFRTRTVRKHRNDSTVIRPNNRHENDCPRPYFVRNPILLNLANFKPVQKQTSIQNDVLQKFFFNFQPHPTPEPNNLSLGPSNARLDKTP